MQWQSEVEVTRANALIVAALVVAIAAVLAACGQVSNASCLKFTMSGQLGVQAGQSCPPEIQPAPLSPQLLPPPPGRASSDANGNAVVGPPGS